MTLAPDEARLNVRDTQPPVLPPPPSEPTEGPGQTSALIEVSADLTDAEIDAATRDTIVTMILGHAATYTPTDEKDLASGLAQLAIFAKQTARELKMASPTTSAKIVFQPGDSHVFGWAKTTVRTR